MMSFILQIKPKVNEILQFLEKWLASDDEVIELLESQEKADEA